MELLSAKEVASRLGVTQQTVSRLSRQGELEYGTVGQRRVYDTASIDAYLGRHNLVPAPPDHPRMGGGEPEHTVVSFFSGALGLDLGMEKAGLPSQLFCENDVRCRMTIAENRPESGLLGDVNRVGARDVFAYAGISPNRGIDVMHGGPPCQAFSTAGARRAFNDARGNVFLRYLELAAELRPAYLVIENVRGLLSTAYPVRDGGQPVRGGAMRTVLNRLEDMGYGVSFNLYNAANFGSPQIRERVVIIAKRDGTVMPWLTPTNSNDSTWGLPAWHTLGEALANVGEPLHYVQFPEKRLRYFRMLGAGQYWKDLPMDCQAEAMGKAYALSGGKTGFYRRLSMERPCATLVTSPTMPATDLCHPTEDRPLSVEEYEAVQEFPATWHVCGTIQDQYRQVGNAVPVALGVAIGRAILDDMAGNRQDGNRFRGFPYSRYRHTSNETWNFV